MTSNNGVGAGLAAGSGSARNQARSFSVSASSSTTESTWAGCLAGVMSMPAYRIAVTYSGSRMPFSASSAPDSSSSGRRSARMRPSLTSTMRSTLRQSTSSRRCSMMRTVVSVFCWIASISSMACLPVAGSRFASGSSNSKIFTSSTMTPARLTRCFWPPESSCGA